MDLFTDETGRVVSATDSWAHSWKPFIEGVSHPHHFGTLTFKSAPNWKKAIQEFKLFLLKRIVRTTKQHILVWFVYDTQPHRSADGEDVYHIHYVMSFELEPLSPLKIAMMWNLRRKKGNAVVSWYDEERGAIPYMYIKHTRNEFYPLCPNIQHSHKKYGCPYHKDYSNWRQLIG